MSDKTTAGVLTFLRRARHPTVLCGDVSLTVDPGHGGCLALTFGGQQWTLGTEVVLDGPACEEVVRQEFDPSPELIVLEEGVDRLGLRVLYRMFTSDGVPRGEGMQDIWLTKAGEAFLSLCVRVAAPEPLGVLSAELGFTTSAPHRALSDSRLESGQGEHRLLVAWPMGRGRRNDGVRWDRTAPPFYERWPSLFDQWSLDPATFGWDRHPTGGYASREGGFGLCWTRERLLQQRERGFRSIVFLGLGTPDRTAQLVAAHEQPAAPALVGARLRGYDELDGTFEIVLEGISADVKIGPRPALEPIRLRVAGVDAGQRIDCEGPARILHTSERGRTDDPLVAVSRSPVGPADEAVLTVDAGPKPVSLRLSRGTGLHLAYQRRSPSRVLTVHHPMDIERPICRVELETLRLRDVRLPSAERAAIHDLPLFYARYLAKASTHLANVLESIEVVSDTGSLVALRLRSSTPDGTIHSTYDLMIPSREECVEVAIETALVGADRWTLSTFEFADIFPEETIDPSRWDYERLVLLAGDEVRSYDVRDPYPHLRGSLETPAPALAAMSAAHGQPGYGPWSLDGTVGFVFFGSPRGTIVGHAATRTAGASCVATICEHWVDLHLDVAFDDDIPVASELGSSAAAVVSELTASLSLLVLPREAADLDDAIELARSRISPQRSPGQDDAPDGRPATSRRSATSF